MEKQAGKGFESKGELLDWNLFSFVTNMPYTLVERIQEAGYILMQATAPHSITRRNSRIT